MPTQPSFRCFLIAALTADGFIGRDSTHLSTRWTSKEDAEFYRTKSKEAGVIIMGRKTFDTMGKPLPGRINVVYTRQAPAGQATLENATKLEPGQLYYTSLAPAQVIEKLAQLGQTQLAVSGGASVYRQFLQAGVVDELFLTIEPVLFGEGVKLLDQSTQLALQLQEVIQLSNQTIVLHYQVKN